MMENISDYPPVLFKFTIIMENVSDITCKCCCPFSIVKCKTDYTGDTFNAMCKCNPAKEYTVWI